MVQPLAFAYLLAGGLLIASAVENIPLAELVKHGLKGAKLTNTSKTVAGFEAGVGAVERSEGGGGSGGGAGTGTSTQAPVEGPKASAPAKAATEGIFNEQKKKLEKFLGRPLTKKETTELHQVQKEGKL